MIIQGVDIDSLPQTLGYNADGTLAYVQVVVPGSGTYPQATYRQSMTYVNGQLTGIGGWVKQ